MNIVNKKSFKNEDNFPHTYPFFLSFIDNFLHNHILIDMNHGFEVIFLTSLKLILTFNINPDFLHNKWDSKSSEKYDYSFNYNTKYQNIWALKAILGEFTLIHTHIKFYKNFPEVYTYLTEKNEISFTSYDKLTHSQNNVHPDKVFAITTLLFSGRSRSLSLMG